jgi:hypothetical protein
MWLNYKFRALSATIYLNNKIEQERSFIGQMKSFWKYDNSDIHIKKKPKNQETKNKKIKSLFIRLDVYHFIWFIHHLILIISIFLIVDISNR